MKSSLIILLCLTFFFPIEVNPYWGTAYPTIAGTPVSQHFKHLGHVGVDFTLYVGSPVYAVKTGVVINTGLERVYGRFIMIKHLDKHVSLYGHLSEIKIKEGKLVYVGTLIGLSGGDKDKDPEGAGWSSSPHLHYEIRVPDHLDNNLYNIDPMKYIGYNDEE